MSSGLAEPTLSFVTPHVSFPAAHVVNSTPQFVPHLGAAHIGAAIHHLVVPAAIGLGALSAAVLAGRAAMATAQGLALATVRAAEAQRCLQVQRLEAQQAAEQWNDATLAIAKVNARATALRGLQRRMTGSAGPDGGAPPAPPPLIDPTGLSLQRVYALIAERDQELRQAEAEQHLWVMRQAQSAAKAPGSDPQDEQWRRRLDEHRAAVLKRYAEAADASTAEAHFSATQLPDASLPAPDASAAREAVERFAEALFGSLDRDVAPQDYELLHSVLSDARNAAAQNPRSVKRYLAEARTLARTAARQAALRREEREQIALQLNFLRKPPVEAPWLPDAAAEVALLEEALSSGVPLTAEERDQVFFRCSAWAAKLESHYKAVLIEAALLDGDQDGEQTGRISSGGHNQFEFRPEGWPLEYWIRVSVDQMGTVRLATKRQASPGEDTEEQRERDRHYCALAKQQSDGLAAVLARFGAHVDLRIVDARVEPVHGKPPNAPPPRRSDKYRQGPKARQHPTDGRSRA